MTPGKPEESLILKRIQAEEMPPRKRLVEAMVKPVEADELAKLWAERLNLPVETMHAYFTKIIRYEIGPREEQALAQFGEYLRHLPAISEGGAP